MRLLLMDQSFTLPMTESQSSRMPPRQVCSPPQRWAIQDISSICHLVCFYQLTLIDRRTKVKLPSLWLTRPMIQLRQLRQMARPPEQRSRKTASNLCPPLPNPRTLSLLLLLMLRQILRCELRFLLLLFPLKNQPRTLRRLLLSSVQRIMSFL
jgi:hypothetical protein